MAWCVTGIALGKFGNNWNLLHLPMDYKCDFVAPLARRRVHAQWHEEASHLHVFEYAIWRIVESFCRVT